MHGATDAARSSRFIVPKILPCIFLVGGDSPPRFLELVRPIGDHVFKRCPHALNWYFTSVLPHCAVANGRALQLRPNGDEADATAAVIFLPWTTINNHHIILLLLMLMLDVAVCLMCLMCLLMRLLAHAVDCCVDM